MFDIQPREPIDFARENLPQTLPLSDVDIFNMFLHILRVPALFTDAKRLLRPDLFDLTSEPHYRLFWATVLEFCEIYGTPHYAALFQTMQSKLRVDPEVLSPQAYALLFRQDVGGLLWYCAFCPPDYLLPDYGRRLLQQFLKERAVVYPIRDMLFKSGHQAYIENFEKIVDAVADQLQSICSLDVAPVAGVLPARGTALPPPIIYVPTNIGHFDDFILGQRVGDCNAILGVYASGKTVQAVHLSVQNARNFYCIGAETNTKPKLSVLASYEEPETKINPRIWSNACFIDKAKLEGLRDWSELTTQANLSREDYELAGNAAGHGLVLSESDRWDVAHIWLNESFRLLDLSGSEKYPGAGTGHIDELIGALERLRSDNDAEIGAVAIDYAKLMCMRYMHKKSINEDKLRHFLTRIGDELRHRIAEQFRCTVWLFHQLAPDQSSRPSTTLMTHTDSSESKAFAENMAACGCLGVKDRRTGCILFNWSKVRYYEQRSRTMPVLQIDGRYSRMIDVSHEYFPDPLSRSFIDPTTRHQIFGPEPLDPLARAFDLNGGL